jgi:hypothetical protein
MSATQLGFRQLGLISGRLLNVRVLTSGTSYTPTSGTKSALIQLLGGGGGGGGATGVASSTGMGGGGGAGGFVQKFLASVGAGPFTIAIGSAGTAGASTGAAGGTGGSTTFNDGTTTYTASGGVGGSGQVGGTAQGMVAGGAGGASANGEKLGVTLAKYQAMQEYAAQLVRQDRRIKPSTVRMKVAKKFNLKLV